MHNGELAPGLRPVWPSVSTAHKAPHILWHIGRGKGSFSLIMNNVVACKLEGCYRRSPVCSRGESKVTFIMVKPPPKKKQHKPTWKWIITSAIVCILFSSCPSCINMLSAGTCLPQLLSAAPLGLTVAQWQGGQARQVPLPVRGSTQSICGLLSP